MSEQQSLSPDHPLKSLEESLIKLDPFAASEQPNPPSSVASGLSLAPHLYPHLHSSQEIVTLSLSPDLLAVNQLLSISREYQEGTIAVWDEVERIILHSL